MNPSIKPAVKTHPERVSDRESCFRSSREVTNRPALCPPDFEFAVRETIGGIITLIVKLA